MHAALKPSSQTKNAQMSVRYPWRSFAHPIDMTPPLQRVRARVAIEHQRQDWLAIGAAVRNATSGRLSQAGKCVSFAARRGRGKGEVDGSNRVLSSPLAASLNPAQRRTLEAGSCVVLGGLGFGFQLGSWPVWTFLAWLGIYAAWVVLYAEITVQTTRHPGLWKPRRCYVRRPSRSRASLEPASNSMPKPAQEKRTA